MKTPSKRAVALSSILLCVALSGCGSSDSGVEGHDEPEATATTEGSGLSADEVALLFDDRSATNGSVIAAATIGEDNAASVTAMSLDGKYLWQVPIPVEGATVEDVRVVAAEGSPVIVSYTTTTADDGISAGGTETQATAFDDDGKVAWTGPVDGDALLVADEVLIIARDSGDADTPARTSAYDVTSGKRIWQKEGFALGLSEGVVFVYEDTNDDDVTRALDIETGKEWWNTNALAGPSNSVGSTRRYIASSGTRVVIEVYDRTLAGDGGSRYTIVDSATGRNPVNVDSLDDNTGLIAHVDPEANVVVIDDGYAAVNADAINVGIVAVDLTTGKIVWSQGKDDVADGTFAKFGGQGLTWFETANDIIAIDSKTGKTVQTGMEAFPTLLWDGHQLVNGRIQEVPGK